MNRFFYFLTSEQTAISRVGFLKIINALWCLLAIGCNTKVSHTVPSSTKQHGSAVLEETNTGVQPGEIESKRKSAIDRDALISQSESYAEKGELQRASELLRQLLVADPGDTEILFRFASVQAQQGNIDDAISLLDSIPADHPEAGLAALGQAADWCFQSEKYRDAETRFKKLLDAAPDAGIARRQLAYLFNRQGRRHEAAEQIQYLCRLGDVREEELHALMVLSDGVYDDAQSAEELPEESLPYFPIGLSGEARVAFSKHDYLKAAELLRKAIEAEPQVESINAFYGRAIAEAQEEVWFLDWLGTTSTSTQEYAEYWAGLGTYLVEHQQFQEAVRALGEAIRRDPTDARSFRRLNQALVALGKDDDAKRLFDRYVDLRNVTLASNEVATKSSPDPSAFSTIIEGLEKLDRPLEAVLWRSVQAFYEKGSPQRMSELNEERLKWGKSDDAFSSSEHRLCGLELDQYPLANLKPLLANRPTETKPLGISEPLALPVFENVAASIGLSHHYRVASKPQANRFTIYQSLGGGVAVLDFDLDGSPDLYFAQGGADPPAYLSDESNTLYRNTDEQLIDSTMPALATEFRYTIGVTAGDWNQDGFADLVAANMGRSTILLNQGDGTFAASPLDSLDDVTLMRSSIALADISGDALPDIVELNYAHDATITKKPEENERGELIVVGPLDFKPGADRMLINDGSGGRQPQSLKGNLSSDATALGVIITNFDDVPGNEIFIGNDMAPDRFWKRNELGEWGDIAPVVGCALGSSGATTASMGIAAADFDGTGTLDLHITNFENQPVTLLLNRNGTFQDRAVQFKLARDSIPVLGFGCQPLDYNLDGRADIVVSNGHVEDTGTAGQSFKQPPQLFANYGDHFQLSQVIDSSKYFSGLHVGRALAKLDFNRDGLSDFVVTHMDADSALLLNRTETTHGWLSVHLVGTSSERDAIGAKVQLRSSENQWTQWVIAGDGYLCRSESSLHFGVGDAAILDSVDIVWPDGEKQSFEQIQTNQHLLVIQGEPQLFAFEKNSTGSQ